VTIAVMPDDQAERVERLKKERLDAQEAVSRSPTSPLLPPVRQVLDKTRQDLVELQPLLGFVDVGVELPEPDAERVAALREHWLHEDR